MILPVKYSHKHWQEIEEIYLMSFPDEERRPLEDLRALSENDESPFAMLKIMDDGNVAGLLSYWDFGEFRYVEHFAIKSAIRSKGTGSAALNEFIAMSATPVVLEVERPGSNDMADRRIGFYRRHGFETLDEYDYVQPPYSPGLPAVPLLLMTTDAAATDPDKTGTTLHKMVYGVD